MNLNYNPCEIKFSSSLSVCPSLSLSCVCISLAFGLFSAKCTPIDLSKIALKHSVEQVYSSDTVSLYRLPRLLSFGFRQTGAAYLNLSHRPVQYSRLHPFTQTRALYLTQFSFRQTSTVYRTLFLHKHVQCIRRSHRQVQCT